MPKSAVAPQRVRRRLILAWRSGQHQAAVQVRLRRRRRSHPAPNQVARARNIKTLIAASVTGSDPPGLDEAAVAYLKKLGLLTRNPANAKIRIFSPIFAAFIRQQGASRVGGISLDTRSGHVLRNGTPLHEAFTPFEIRLLAYFLEHEGELCEKNAIIAHVWPDEKLIEGIRDDSLAQLVKRLRDKLEADGVAHNYIQSVRGRGYRFVQGS